MAGVDVATMPHDVIQQLVGHPLTDIGQDQILADWNRLNG